MRWSGRLLSFCTANEDLCTGEANECGIVCNASLIGLKHYEGLHRRLPAVQEDSATVAS